MNKPIIFLDIDGVLRNSRSSILESGPRFHDRVFDPVNIAYLQRLVELSGAGVVISSMWKEPNAHYVYLSNEDKEKYRALNSIQAKTEKEWYLKSYSLFAELFYDIKEFILSKFPDWKPPLENDWFVPGYYKIDTRPCTINDYANAKGYTNWIMIDDFGDCTYPHYIPHTFPRAIFCNPSLGFSEPEYRRSLTYLNIKDEKRYGQNWGWDLWTERGDPDCNQKWLQKYLNKEITDFDFSLFDNIENVWNETSGPRSLNQNSDLHERFKTREEYRNLLNSMIF